MSHTCYHVGAIALLLSQLAWAIASLHPSASPAACGDIAGRRALAIGTLILAIALAATSLRHEGATVPAATVSLISTATTAWYASSLRPGSSVARAGHGAALFSTAAALLLLAADMAAASEPRGALAGPDPGGLEDAFLRATEPRAVLVGLDPGGREDAFRAMEPGVVFVAAHPPDTFPPVEIGEWEYEDNEEDVFYDAVSPRADPYRVPWHSG
eukprot:jgi/Tetstr1/454062/TSEL_040981.t1